MTDLQHIAVLGDSQTVLATSYGVQGFECWPAKVQQSLRRAGKRVRVHVAATGGHDTSNLLARISDAFPRDGLGTVQPRVAILAIGVNDPGNFTTSQTQANIQAAIKAIKHRAIGDGFENCAPVAGQANLPANGLFGQRYVVLNDTSTTGGQPATDPDHHATVPGSVAADANGQRQSVWEYRMPMPGEAGWGRVRGTTGDPLVGQDGTIIGCSRIVVVSANYLNFASTGDTLTTPYAVYAAIRSAQQAAVAAENVGACSVQYADQYSYERGLIAAGTIPNRAAGDAYDATRSLHYADGNQHFSPLGHATRERVVTPLVLPSLA